MTGLRRAVATVLALAAATGLVLVAAPAASAHVTVSPSGTQAGGYAVLTFRVPNESPTARTVGVSVQLPQGTPFTSALTEPVPGWTAKVTTSALATPLTDDDGNAITSAPTQVTWTATGDGLAPGEFAELRLSVGPLPKSGTVYLPAVQTYSDGTEVDWVQQAQGGAEPEHPAPSFAVTAATGADAGGPAASTSAASTSAASTSAAADDGPTARLALGFAVAALVVALAAAGIAVRAARRPVVLR